MTQTINELTKEKPFLEYKGKPLVRRGNTIYYGKFNDKYIIEMTITEAVKFRALDVSTKIIITLRTNTGTDKERVIKKAEREGLYRALDIAAFWLEEELNGGQ